MPGDKSTQSTPLILVFLKSPVVGSVKTRLAKSIGAEKATEVYRVLVERQLQQLPNDWKIHIYFTPEEDETFFREWLGNQHTYKNQATGNLGDRLKAAFQEGFRDGFSQIFAIGGDCPYLTKDYFREAHNKLNRNHAVLGPAQDGGYYLLGLTHMDLDPLFDDIPWGGPEVAMITRQRLLMQEHIYEELPILEDVDDLESWQRAQDYLNQLSS